MILEYRANEQCAICGGRCCKLMACHYSPMDFKDLSFDGLKAEIEKGKISIDWWEGAIPQYYLRARNVDAPIVDPSWGGVCVHLTEDGCALAFEERPLGGRSLEPRRKFTGRCVPHYTKEECKDEWAPYAETLVNLVAYFRQNEVLNDG